MALSKIERKARIRKRIRKVVSGTAERLRLSVFRSNNEIYAQLINDETGTTLVAASTMQKDIREKIAGMTKVEAAREVGKALAIKALEKGIEVCAFDRGGNLYHGRVKALAEGAREGGLKF
ncbi:50S ribosomal protein L18 [Thermaurantimonas aggregans]|uniref:Large ribosomal subunit protein uL18 n=1 Tax=Thermaurantimonas aggregans TaxID=2173829 RepID=A0A401XN54_9FLAO|nr:50S ribosomal protein L18 [Thermaurantimonas aggregans]MCX8149576.1 50S ribosomal protein L18 [Thermaurantimonas aggregans]GCD78446.1 50S ribosomal protein L18 [Thermaurantimonas aggregans]